MATIGLVLLSTTERRFLFITVYPSIYVRKKYDDDEDDEAKNGCPYCKWKAIVPACTHGRRA